MEADKHVRCDSHDSKLEEPMEEHVECVAHAPDPRWEDLGAVQKLDGAQPDRPTDGIYEHAGYGSLRCPFVGLSMADPDTHIDGHCATVSRRQEVEAS